MKNVAVTTVVSEMMNVEVPSFTKDELEAFKAKNGNPAKARARVGAYRETLDALEKLHSSLDKKNQRIKADIFVNDDGTVKVLESSKDDKVPGCNSRGLFYVNYQGGRNVSRGNGMTPSTYKKRKRPVITIVQKDYIPRQGVWILKEKQEDALVYIKCTGIECRQWTMSEKLLALYLKEVHGFTHRHIGKILGREKGSVKGCLEYMRVKGLGKIANLPKRRFWTNMEEMYLIKCISEGDTYKEAAEKLGRSEGSVATKIRALRQQGRISK